MVAEAAKQEGFTNLEKRIGVTCKKLAMALGSSQRGWTLLDEVPPVNRPSDPASSKPRKHKVNARAATSPPPIPRPSKKSRNDQGRKTKRGMEVFDAVVIKTPVPRYNLELTRFMDNCEIERRKYHAALVNLEHKLREIGIREPVNQAPKQ